VLLRHIVLLDAQLAETEPAHERGTARQNADLTVVERQRDEVRRLVEQGAFRRDDDTAQLSFGFCHDCHFPSAASFLACSSASSMAPTYMNACSGRWSHLPSHSSLKLRIVSRIGVILPSLFVNASATRNGCDRNFSMRRARDTTFLSSSLSSSTPRMAMMSCSSR